MSERAEPEVASTEPEAAAAEPEVASTEPEAAATQPEEAGIEPEAAATEPEAAAIEAEVATQPEPVVVQAEPVVVYAEPFEPGSFEVDPTTGGRRSMVIEGIVCLITAIGIAGLGAPIGLLWSTIAPKVELIQTQVGPYPLEAEPEGYVADEGWFIFIAIAAGVVFAVLTWFVLRRFRGPAMLVALVAGSIGGSVLAAWLGHRVGLPAYERLVRDAPPGTHIFRPARIRLSDVGLYFGFLPRVRGVVLLQGLVAAALYTAFAGFSYSPSLKPELPVPPVADPPAFYPVQGEQPPLSWGSPAPQDPAAAPAPPAPAAEAQPLDVAWRARPEDG